MIDPMDIVKKHGKDIAHIAQWAAGRETSRAVAVAILFLASDLDEAQRIWGSPTPDEIRRVEKLAWGQADYYTGTLYWGANWFVRPGRLYGWDAIDHVKNHGGVLNNYNTALESAGLGIDINLAEDIARDDPSLIFCDVK